MSLTFIDQMRNIANDDALAKRIIAEQLQEKQEQLKEKQNEVKHCLFMNLTNKYYNFITEAIKYASLSGRTYKHMNFFRNDFKANFPGLGNPVQIQEEWLTELCRENSVYIPPNGRCLIGLKFTIWNNRSFTTVFTWNNSNDVNNTESSEC